MRNIINISLPRDLARLVQTEVRRGHYATTSEFFRHLLRTHILAQELHRKQKHFDTEKIKVLRNMKDLRS